MLFLNSFIVDNAVKKIELDLKGKTANYAKMKLIENGENLFFIAGAYSNEALDKKFTGRTNGLFTLTGSDEASTQIHEFSNDFLSNFLNEKLIEKGIGLSPGYEPKDIISFNNGTSLTIVMEQSGSSSTITTTEHSLPNGGNHTTSSSSITELYGTLIIPTFSANGELTNMEYIEKDRNEIPCGLASNEDKLYLFFQDSKDKEEAKNLNGKSSWKYLDLVTLNPKGEIINRKVVSSRKQNKLPFNTEVCSLDGKNLLLFRSVSNVFMLGILKL